MAATTSYSPTGDSLIDGILGGTKWASTELTFSFPTSSSVYEYTSEANNNFEAFTSVQQEAVKDVLANFAAVSNLTFTEIAETSTQHATMRYAESDAPSTAWAYYPSISVQGGDAWFNNSSNYYDNPVKGNYAYLTMLHETGHALGLKHGHEVKGAFGALPAEFDSLEYSVMSYKSYVGGGTSGYTNGSASYPQSLMMLDIAALQHLYGANYSTNAGNTIYKWSSTTGEMFIDGQGEGAPAGNKIFLTVWDGGGDDTYDLSNYTGSLNVNLAPGEWSTVSPTQLAVLGGGHYATGNIANALMFNDNPASLIENAIGGAGADTMVGNIANNKLTGGKGNDLLDGAEGADAAVYSGLSAFYSWLENADGSWTVTDLGSGKLEGVDTLWNIETLQFADLTVTIGDTVPPPPPPTSTNSAPVYQSTSPSVTVAEWADGSANEVANALHTATGQMSFSDANAGDLHVASFTPQGTGYLGTFSLSGVNQTADTFNWSFAVADNVMDYLKSGQYLVQKYDVLLEDGNGGSVVQTVTVTLSGADDVVLKGGKPGGGTGGKGKSGGSGQSDDIHMFLEIQHDEAPAPVSYDLAPDMDAMSLLGAGYLDDAYWQLGGA